MRVCEGGRGWARGEVWMGLCVRGSVDEVGRERKHGEVLVVGQGAAFCTPHPPRTPHQRNTPCPFYALPHTPPPHYLHSCLPRQGNQLRVPPPLLPTPVLTPLHGRATFLRPSPSSPSPPPPSPTPSPLLLTALEQHQRRVPPPLLPIHVLMQLHGRATFLHPSPSSPSPQPSPLGPPTQHCARATNGEYLPLC